MFCCLKNCGKLEYNSNDNLVILINYGNYENIVVEHNFSSTGHISTLCLQSQNPKNCTFSCVTCLHENYIKCCFHGNQN